MLPSLEDNLVNERKFSGHISCLNQAMALLETNCAHDDWFAEGFINSIYFDTPGFSAYWEKANGDNLKTKIRIRWYGHDDELQNEVPVFIEVKGRIGSARRKMHCESKALKELITAVPFESGELTDFLVSKASALDLPLSLRWEPVCCITYRRRRYFDTPSRSRVSIDWDIRADRFNRRLFPWATPVALDAVVCEFKNSGGAPPHWADSMQAAGLRFGSFSKYGECMERLITGVQ